ncbi:hypothetical protein JK154_06985 [Citrobacter sp. JGM124]|nr:hypothetical protein [Citrobacter sp. JGM124]
MFSMDKVQVGLDLATSVTILAAAFTWWLNKRKERKAGVIDSARATIIENINQATNEMALSFNAFVNFAVSIERKIDRPARISEEYFLEKIRAGEIDYREINSLFTDNLKTMNAFYERASTLRYTIFPSLYSIGHQIDAIRLIKKEISDVLVSYNSSNSSYVYFAKEISDLLEKIAVTKKTSDNDVEIMKIVFSEYHQEISSIIKDSDYHIFLISYVEKEREYLLESMKSDERDKYTEDESDLLNDLAHRLVAAMINSPEDIIAIYLKRLSMQIQENRKQCKEFLVTLSAVSSKMQQRTETLSIEQAYKDLSSNDYLATEKEIR